MVIHNDSLLMSHRLIPIGTEILIGNHRSMQVTTTEALNVLDYNQAVILP